MLARKEAMPKKTTKELLATLRDLTSTDLAFHSEILAAIKKLDGIETRAAEVKTKARKVYEDTSIDAVSCLDDCADYILGKRERFALHEFHDSIKAEQRKKK